MNLLILVLFFMFLNNFFLLFPETPSMFWYLGDCPFYFYSVQDSNDLYAKK